MKDQIIHITVIFVIVMGKDLIQLSVFCSFNSEKKGVVIIQAEPKFQ